MDRDGYRSTISLQSFLMGSSANGMHAELSLHCRSSLPLDPASCRSFFASRMMFYTLKAIIRLMFWERFVSGVTWGGGRRALGSPGKRVLPSSNRWQLLVWLMLPLISTSASSLAVEVCEEF